MMSIQFLTRNLRRIASLRGFSSASVTEKSVITEKTENNTKQTQSKTSKSFDRKYLLCVLFHMVCANLINTICDVCMFCLLVFGQLKSLEQPTLNQQEKTAIQTKPITKSTSKPKVEGGKSSVTLATRISNATTVLELLQLSEKILSRQNAMSILTKLSAWTASNQANVTDFENDYRFLKVCRQISEVSMQKGVKNIIQNHQQQKSAELEMVLNIAGDEEASKIVETLSLPQKVKVFSSLARKKTRSIVVLKALATTISGHADKLNLKECSDLLFAMTSLNFIDEMLLCRISMDINDGLVKNLNKSAVVGSIVTSLGFLKYKEPALLDNLTEWIIKKQEFCRPKDLTSLILTLALLNYRPKNVDDITSKILPKITRNDLLANEWLDYVWALSVLELHQSNHLESILR